MTAAFPVTTAYNKPVSQNLTVKPVTMAELKQRLGTQVLNTSRVALDARSLVGIRDDQPVPVSERLLPRTRVARLDQMLEKTGDAGAFAWYGGRNLIVDSLRGGTLGTLAGGALGLTAGGLAHAARRSWPLQYCLIVGGTLGGWLGMGAGSTASFISSGLGLLKDGKAMLERQYQVAKAADWFDGPSEK